jgi:Flp pilus assembly protein protease CpaA
MDGDQTPDDKTLRYLKVLVTVLTVTMIGGFLTIVTLFVMRFSAMNTMALPNEITLPDGAMATAFTQGQGWFAVVTQADEILIYSRTTGNLRQRITIQPE